MSNKPTKSMFFKELAVTYYRKALEAIPKDSRPDKEFLEQLKRGAEEKLKELDKAGHFP